MVTVRNETILLFGIDSFLVDGKEKQRAFSIFGGEERS